VDRVLRVEVLDDTFAPPVDLDPVAAVEAHLGLGWEFEVEVLVDAPAEQVARWVPATMGRVEPVDEGSCRLVGSTGNPTGYAADLAHLPTAYHVVVGDEVRAATRALGERLLAAAAT
jgi:hypothetical protein